MIKRAIDVVVNMEMTVNPYKYTIITIVSDSEYKYLCADVSSKEME